jgi:hypothetical protein
LRASAFARKGHHTRNRRGRVHRLFVFVFDFDFVVVAF